MVEENKDIINCNNINNTDINNNNILNNNNNNSINWSRSPPIKHRHTIDKINISTYRTLSSTTLNGNKKQQRRNSKTIQQLENDEEKESKRGGGESEGGMLTLQHCMARLADLAKGYGSISLVCYISFSSLLISFLMIHF